MWENRSGKKCLFKTGIDEEYNHNVREEDLK
jgi:hypothetical protein